MAIYCGIDSNTSSFPSGATKDFYIGCLGHKVTADANDWDSTGAGLAKNVYGFWFLHGPMDDPTYASSTYTATKATQWGITQAECAYVAREAKTACNTLTLFGDVEITKDDSGVWHYYGWLHDQTASSYTINYAVFTGFINYINGSTSYNPGCYCSSGPWTSIMGSSTSHSPTYETSIFWGANWINNNTVITPPTSMTSAPTVNGSTASIWQYHGVTADYDIASYVVL